MLFDLDGTLISSYMDTPTRAYNAWQVLPGRRERVQQLCADEHQLGIVTNQAGVAFGYITETQVYAKLAAVVRALQLPPTTPVAVCFAHPDARQSRYRDPVEVARLPPSGRMIQELMRQYPGDAARGVMYIGDRPDDATAAKHAGVLFVAAEVFFSSRYRLPYHMLKTS